MRIACQKSGLKTPERIRKRERGFQSSEREAMNLSPGGTFLHDREEDMTVCGRLGWNSDV